MKKIITLFAITSMALFTSCSADEVAPLSVPEEPTSLLGHEIIQISLADGTQVTTTNGELQLLIKESATATKTPSPSFGGKPTLSSPLMAYTAQLNEGDVFIARFKPSGGSNTDNNIGKTVKIKWRVKIGDDWTNWVNPEGKIITGGSTGNVAQNVDFEIPLP